MRFHIKNILLVGAACSLYIGAISQPTNSKSLFLRRNPNPTNRLTDFCSTNLIIQMLTHSLVEVALAAKILMTLLLVV